MISMRVVIDSNIFIGSFRFDRTPLHRLFSSNLDAAGIKLLIPKVVVREVENKLAEELRERQRKTQSTLRELRRFGFDEVESPLSDAWLDAALDNYRLALHGHLSKVGASVLDYPLINHEWLVERDLAREKPFGVEGRGYRDALIWANVLELARQSPAPIAFVTGNTADFCSKSGALHCDLIETLEELGFDPSSFHFFASLEEFNDVFLQPLEQLAEIRAALETGQYGFLDLRTGVPPELEALLEGRSFDPPDIGLPEEAEDATLYTLDELLAINVGDVSRLPSGEILIQAQLEINATFEVEVVADTLYGWEISPDHDFDKSIVHGFDQAAIRLNITLTLDEESGEVTSTEVAEVEGVQTSRYLR